MRLAMCVGVLVLACALTASVAQGDPWSLSTEELEDVTGAGGYDLVRMGGDPCATGDGGCQPDEQTWLGPPLNDDKVVPGTIPYSKCKYCTQCQYVIYFQVPGCHPPILEEGWIGARYTCIVSTNPNLQLLCPEEQEED